MSGYKLWASVICGLVLTGAGASLALADISDVDSAERIATETSVTVGYRGVGSDDNPGRAREYDSLESSALLKAKYFTDQGPYHLNLGIDYLNEDDYSAEAHLDYGGLLRLDLRNQRFFHNLDHIPYDNGYSGAETGPPMTRTLTGSPAEGSRTDARFPTSPTTRFDDKAMTIPNGTTNPAYRGYYSDQNPGDDYGLRLDFSEAKLKVKCPDYPAHATLSYWRYEKEGEKQMRFVGENCTTACHMQSKTRKIDYVTEEVKAGADAHVGFIDIALEGLLRTFRDREPVPVDYFGTHSSRGPRAAGSYEHDEAPDSQLKEFTVKLSTAPSGGFVASAAFTVGERENQSDLNSVAPVHAETDYYRASADATYTPSQNWTFNLRYRLLDMDSDNSSALNDLTGQAFPETAAGTLPVRASVDITRAWYEAIASYRPWKSLTLKAEFRREEIDRSATGDATAHTYNGPGTLITGINTNWELPDEENITQVKLGFSSRLLERSALKLSGWLAIQQNDNPAYGTSVSEGQELFLTSSYTPSPFWGMQANLNLLKQENNDHELDGYDLEREKEQQNLSLGTWVNPREGLSFDLNYGYFHTVIDQDLLFGSAAGYAIEDDSVDYRQTVQTVTAGMTWQALENLSCRVEGYHIRSEANYSPNFASGTFAYTQRVGPAIYYFPGEASSSDLEEISKVEIRQNGLRGRVDWQIDELWTCGVEATYDNYDEVGNDIYDGSVQTAMVSFSRSW